MKVVAATDAEIRAAVGDPSRVLAMFRGNDSAPLWDMWQTLDFLLGGDTPILRGDIAIADSDPVHGLFSDHVKPFADSLREVTEATLRGNFDSDKMRAAGMFRVLPEYAEQTCHEAWTYFVDLRALIDRAVASGSGLVFCRYEDY